MRVSGCILSETPCVFPKINRELGPQVGWRSGHLAVSGWEPFLTGDVS
jgi:hypothetical protein